jgi:hypothetical protein
LREDREDSPQPLEEDPLLERLLFGVFADTFITAPEFGGFYAVTSSSTGEGILGVSTSASVAMDVPPEPPRSDPHTRSEGVDGLKAHPGLVQYTPSLLSLMRSLRSCITT